jgi:tripartite-type tricarboxylate transporter receptor subunit TctC
VSSLKRNSALPDVPTVSEAALPGFNLNAWLGILVPAGTPANVIERLHAATVTALQRPEVSERLTSLGLEAVGSTPAHRGKKAPK